MGFKVVDRQRFLEPVNPVFRQFSCERKGSFKIAGTVRVHQQVHMATQPRQFGEAGAVAARSLGRAAGGSPRKVAAPVAAALQCDAEAVPGPSIDVSSFFSEKLTCTLFASLMLAFAALVCTTFVLS